MILFSVREMQSNPPGKFYCTRDLIINYMTLYYFFFTEGRSLISSACGLSKESINGSQFIIITIRLLSVVARSFSRHSKHGVAFGAALLLICVQIIIVCGTKRKKTEKIYVCKY